MGISPPSWGPLPVGLGWWNLGNLSPQNNQASWSDQWFQIHEGTVFHLLLYNGGSTKISFEPTSTISIQDLKRYFFIKRLTFIGVQSVFAVRPLFFSFFAKQLLLDAWQRLQQHHRIFNVSAAKNLVARHTRHDYGILLTKKVTKCGTKGRPSDGRSQFDWMHM